MTDAAAKVYETGVLDTLLRSGLVVPKFEASRGLVILIKGDPGTGKSTLALQIAQGLAKRNIGILNYHSLEQTTDDMERKYETILANSPFEPCDIRVEALKEKLAQEEWKTIRESLNIELSSLDCRGDDDKKKECGKTGAGILNTVLNLLDSGITRSFFNDGDKPVLGDRRAALEKKLGDAIQEPISGVSFTDYRNEPPASPEQPLDSEYSALSRALGFLEKMTSSDPCLLMVVDGLNILNESDRGHVNLHRLVQELREKADISVLIYEPTTPAEDYLEYLVDMVIELRAAEESTPIDYYLHRMIISKSRYQDAVLGWQQYKIRKFGIVVFPSVHYQVHRPNAMIAQLYGSMIPVNLVAAKREKENGVKPSEPTNSIIERVLNGVNEGSSVVVLGARGTFKTTIALDFLMMGAKSRQDGMIVSIIDNEKTIRERLACPRQGDEAGCESCSRHLFLFHQRPGVITAAEFLHILARRIDLQGKKIKRLTFWDLTQVEYRFPLLSADPMFLPGLMDYCKQEKINLILMGSGNSRLSKAASATGDNVIFLWRERGRGKADQKENLVSLFVDRSEGSLGGEGKNLFRFRVLRDYRGKECLDTSEFGCGPSLEKRIKALAESRYSAEAKARIDDISKLQGIG